jgi:hypothetical protein
MTAQTTPTPNRKLAGLPAHGAANVANFGTAGRREGQR